jgi:hypothetical protein
MDYCYAHWTLSANKGKAVEAALWAGVLIVLNGLAMVNIVNDLWNLTTAFLGAIIGTYLAIKQGNKKEYDK